MITLSKVVLGLMLVPVLLSAPALADTKTFMPPNTLNKQDKLNAASGITEKEFNDAIDRAVSIYKPMFEHFGAKLTVNRLWSNSTVNASAEQRSATDWQVNMYGGLARRAEVTADGFAMVLCHEIGHHLGGYPYVQEWAADEGQSDQYATSACSAKVFAASLKMGSKAEAELPAAMKEKCDSSHAADSDRKNCYRSMVAGKSLADLLAALGGSTKVAFETPDTSKVSKTNHAHPAAQCRLDTYVSGALCGASKWDYALIPGKSFDNRNSMEAQAEAFGHGCESGLGARPSCWFVAVNSNTPEPAPAECPLGDQAMCDIMCELDPSQPWCK